MDAISEQTVTELMTDEIVKFLISQPSLEAMSEIKTSDNLGNRIRELLDINREGLITPEQNKQLDNVELLGHLMDMLKAHARLRIMEASK